jgi:hypothetical protein
MNNNFPENGDYVGTLCGVFQTQTKEREPAILIRFAVLTDDAEYSPTAFWSFSQKAEKAIRYRCNLINIPYGDVYSVMQRLQCMIGRQFQLSVFASCTGFQQVNFVPLADDEVDKVNEDADDAFSGGTDPYRTLEKSHASQGIYLCHHCGKGITISIG